MKLEKALNQLNSLEKNSFVKIVDSILNENPKTAKEIEKLQEGQTKDLKSTDSSVLTKIFSEIEPLYRRKIQETITQNTSQSDILLDILLRDGNCIMSQDWLHKLYEKEVKKIETRVAELIQLLDSNEEAADIPIERIRDYRIYRNCLKTAFNNDERLNKNKQISSDENDLLKALSIELDLSLDEVRLINYTILKLEHKRSDEIIEELKTSGIIFFVKKSRQVIIPDEFVRSFRLLRGKNLADKYFKRILKHMRDPQINQICRMHNIDRKLSIDEKIKEIVNQGISAEKVLTNSMFKEGTTRTEKRNLLNEFIEKSLSLELTLKGATVEEKAANLVHHFQKEEEQDTINISHDGYAMLVKELTETLDGFERNVKGEFEIEEYESIDIERLLDYNIKPQDLLYAISEDELRKFCEEKKIKSRGNIYSNILEKYKDSDNLLIENYQLIGVRDLNALKARGINFKEQEFGQLFEDITKKIFIELGLNVDESLKKEINTTKDKIDIIIRVDESSILIVECKTDKESGYDKYSSVKRQLKAYSDLAKKNNLNVLRSILVSPNFSDAFIGECELEMDLAISLLRADSLLAILNTFKKSKYQQFPYQLLIKDMLIEQDRVAKALNR